MCEMTGKTLVVCLQYQGDEQKDTDIPTYLEGKLFCTTFGKFVWILLQPFFYALRPLLVYPKSPSSLELINVVIQIAFDYLVYYYFGKLARNQSIIQLTSDMFCRTSRFVGIPDLRLPDGNGTAPGRRPFRQRTLHVQKGSRNLQLLWTIKFHNFQCGLP